MNGDTPIDWPKEEIEAELTDLVTHRMIRGWMHQNGRYAVQYTDIHPDGEDNARVRDVILTFPQVQAFVAGLHAGTGWVTAVAKEVKDAEQPTR